MSSTDQSSFLSLLMPALLPNSSEESSHPKDLLESQEELDQLVSSSPEPPTPSPVAPPRSLLHNLSSTSVLGSGLPPLQASALPSFLSLKSEITHDLNANLGKLLTLNVSRREAIAQYLDRLAEKKPGPSTVNGNSDAAAGLRRWIEDSRREPYSSSLRTYFEEVALITLGQAILLKSWSDRGLRPWSEPDFKDLNWAIHSSLKPWVPVDRESWQIARQNIYSWYKPSASVQKILWQILEKWKVAGEGPEFLGTLLQSARQWRPENLEPLGYDSRFFKALWDGMPEFGFHAEEDPGPLKRNRMIFSPTLRDGSLVRNSPRTLSWIGLEASPFKLLAAEMMELWWGPATPPLWTVGNGLEVQSRDQLSLNLGTPRTSLVHRLTEIEACEIAFVLEEKLIRGGQRNSEAQLFRENADSFPYFKKVRSTGTSLGDLQACVALGKLRPKGLLWWAREEPLSEKDGREVLRLFLEKAKLICEWDFSHVENTLPTLFPLFPKYLYLFSREPGMENRLNHRPARVSLRGHLRSHVELPGLLEDALNAAKRQIQPRGQWEIHHQMSPTLQRDWTEVWPDPASQDSLQVLEKLRQSSLPLANVATIRAPSPASVPIKTQTWTTNACGIWLESDCGPEGRKVVATPLTQLDGPRVGLVIGVPHATWLSPLIHYLESPTIQEWFEHHAERKSGKWVLNEPLLKWLPVPKSLLHALGYSEVESEFAPLDSETEDPISQLQKKPGEVLEALSRLPFDKRGLKIRAELFVRTSQQIHSLQREQEALSPVINAEGQVSWGQLMGVLAKSECIPLTLHPEIQISGSMPPHVAISRIERTPEPGVMFATEIGFTLKIATTSLVLMDILWDQLKGLSNPTWSELIQYLKVPRRLELAQATAADVLKLHSERNHTLKELYRLLAGCPFA